MAYFGSKGWYVARLKELGLNRHPQEQRKLELYKAYILRNLYEEQLEKQKGDN